MLAEKESAAPAQGIIPLCNLKTRKTGTGFYACPLFAILKMLLSLRRQRIPFHTDAAKHFYLCLTTPPMIQNRGRLQIV